MLVSVEQLRAHLDDARWCVVDVRHDLFDADAGIRAYREGHIPGAVFASIDTQLSGKKTGLNGRHPLPRRDDLVETFREWGINQRYADRCLRCAGRPVCFAPVVVSALVGSPTCRVARRRMAEVVQAIRTLSSQEVPKRSRGNFTASDSMMPLATVHQVLQSLDRQDRTLLDARTPERYRGEARADRSGGGPHSGRAQSAMAAESESRPNVQVTARAALRV